MRKLIESLVRTVSLILHERLGPAELRGDRKRASKKKLSGKKSKKDVFAQRSEDEAANFLRKHGYTILARNYRSRYAEIDIIAQKGDCIAFVEVKARRTDRWGGPFEAVNARKRKKIIALADSYIATHRRRNVAYRFDIISILWAEDEAFPEIEHYEGAFDASGE